MRRVLAQTFLRAARLAAPHMRPLRKGAVYSHPSLILSFEGAGGPLARRRAAPAARAPLTP